MAGNFSQITIFFAPQRSSTGHQGTIHILCNCTALDWTHPPMGVDRFRNWPFLLTSSMLTSWLGGLEAPPKHAIRNIWMVIKLKNWERKKMSDCPDIIDGWLQLDAQRFFVRASTKRIVQVLRRSEDGLGTQFQIRFLNSEFHTPKIR